MGDAKPWDRRADESHKAYQAFTLYLRLGPGRSFDAAWRLHTGRHNERKRAPGYINRWASEHEWAKRAEAYDQHTVDQFLAVREERTQAVILKAEQVALSALAQLQQRIQPAEQSIPLDLRELTAALNAAITAIHRLRPPEAASGGGHFTVSFEGAPPDEEPDEDG